MEYKLIGAPIALYKEFSTGAEKGVEAIQKELGTKIPSLKLAGLTQEKANSKIQKKAKELFHDSKPLFVGGDHSITFPILESFSRPFDVFWFDAHPDAHESYKHRLSHATVLRRIAELPKCKHIYIIGSRQSEFEEREFIRQNSKVQKILPYEIKKIRSPRYYVSIDIDVLDPREAPAVDHPEPKGMSMLVLLKSIKSLRKGNIIGADIVELVPDNDHTGITEKNCAKIIQEFLK